MSDTLKHNICDKMKNQNENVDEVLIKGKTEREREEVHKKIRYEFTKEK